MISVIIPVYNTEKYLSKCIDSILNQTYTDYEIILIDDGSTDHSGKICDQYLSNNIVVIHQTNEGVSAARNKGLDKAKGDYIIFIDSDDWLEPEMFAKMIEYSKSRFDLVVCSYNIVRETKAGTFEYTPKVIWENQTKPFTSNDIYFDVIQKTGTLWNKLIKRSAIVDIRFDTTSLYGEDCLFLCKVVKNIKNAVIIPDPLYNYFSNRIGNVVSSLLDTRTFNFIETGRKIYDELLNQKQPGIAIWRLTVVLNEALNKAVFNFKNAKKVNNVIGECKKLARYPSENAVALFLKDDRIIDSIKNVFLRMRKSTSYFYYRCIRQTLGRIKRKFFLHK